MSSPPLNPTLSFDSNQRFACRDCPARCCKNWSLTATASEVQSLLALPWVRERLAAAGCQPERIGGRTSPAYRLPMRVKGRDLRCVFLDDDDLCSIHRREGHEKLPAICQSFPFSFVRERTGLTHASLSTYCPSIRDNYGEPLAPQLPSKLQQASPFIVQLPETLPLGPHLIAQTDFIQLADFWADALHSGPPLAHVIGAIRDHLTMLQDTLGPSDCGPNRPVPLPENVLSDGRTLLPDLLKQQSVRVGVYQPGLFPFPTRGILASLLLTLAYPTFRAIVEPRPYRFLPGIVRNVLGFATGSFPLTLEGIDQPVRFDISAWKVRGPQPEHEPLIRATLTAGLRSRLHFARAESLPEVLFLLAGGLAIIHLYARLRAAADHRTAVHDDDVRQAVAIADKVCLRHGNLLRVLSASRAVLGTLASLPNAHERLLTACLPDPR